MLKLLHTTLLAVALLLPSFTLTPVAAAAESTGPVVVTVAGAVTKPNRGPMNPFADGFINANNHAFDKATAFTWADLQALPQVEITAQAPGWPGPVKLKGVRLADLLAAAGAEERTVTLSALDNYGVKLTPAEVKAKPWVLGHTADGVPLAVGGRGPLWLAWDTSAAIATKEDEGQWLWAVYLITVD
jgi:hypothetical protein